MNILLTGGAGYIGSHTAVELISRGHSVALADSLVNSSRIVVERIGMITGVTPKLYQIDLTDPALLDSVLASEDFDAVIHFAGHKAVGESVAKPLMYYRNNLLSTINLIEAMERHGVQRLIFSSSATVYGSDNPIPYAETMTPGPCSSPYGWTKLMSEQIINDACAANPKLRAVLLRYFNPVGAHPSGLIGEDPEGIPNNLMPYISQVAVGRREYLNVYGNDYPTRDGTGVRDYIHVVDLAKAHAAALDYSETSTGSEAFNIGSGRGYSVLEVVEAFGKALGRPIPYKFAPRRDGDLAEYYSDPTKANQRLGWYARLTIDQICADSLNWQTKNPRGYEE